MISTNLTGNFGDHVIRYALTRSIAEKNGYEWAINRTPSHDYFRGQEQMYFFDLDYGLPNNVPYGILPPWAEHHWIEKVMQYPNYDFYPYQPEVFSIPDNTHLTIFSGKDARYYDKEKLKKWFTVKEEIVKECEDILNTNGIILDENTTVINCRGGEYRGIPTLFLKHEYYLNAAGYFLKNNPDMKFIVVTEDVEFYRQWFDCPVVHFSIACDYYIVNHAENLILSNSGFAIIPAWLNEYAKNVIAPMHWARHNIGEWANSDMWTFGKNDNWHYLDRFGELYNYDEVIP